MTSHLLTVLVLAAVLVCCYCNQDSTQAMQQAAAKLAGNEVAMAQHLLNQLLHQKNAVAQEEAEEAVDEF